VPFPVVVLVKHDHVQLLSSPDHYLQDAVPHEDHDVVLQLASGTLKNIEITTTI